LMRMSVPSLTLQRLKTEPGIVLFAPHHRELPIDRWIFEKNDCAYLGAPKTDDILRIYLLPKISPN
ncbi:MAG: hypothetical protein ONA90_01070, partial [candidate division KSB1 bacterium]|nr:hypothetical protein [candidate division KSB1 bacterium]